MNYNVNIVANGSPEVVATGSQKHLLIRSATAAFQISFDGSYWKDSGKNEVYSQPFDRVYFRTSGVACSVVFSCDSNPISAQDTAQSTASTAPVGNLGIANATAAANGNPQCDANGFLIITNAMAFKVSGKNAEGNRRQIIIFSLSANSPQALQVMDANGNGFMTIPAGTVIPLVTDGDFILSGAGGDAWVTIGQMFLNSQG